MVNLHDKLFQSLLYPDYQNRGTVYVPSPLKTIKEEETPDSDDDKIEEPEKGKNMVNY